MPTPVDQKVSAVYAREKLQPARPTSVMTINASDAPQSVVIVGSDGAGNAAALMLPQERYAGAIPTLSADDSPPYDRPNLSREALAGTATPWSRRHPSLALYQKRGIDLRLNAHVTHIDTAHKRVELHGGNTYDYDMLLLATGAEGCTWTCLVPICRTCIICAAGPIAMPWSPERRRPNAWS